VPVFPRPPGVYDRAPAEAIALAALTAQLSAILFGAGYQPIDTPLIEYADLFLTKSGDDAINRLFTFELYGRVLCLRPEFTASAARLYVERFQTASKPIRWQLSGPIFRYESPQRSHSRQFTMLGAELIGTSGTAGEAEAIGLAAHGLRSVGLPNWTLRIGHVGLVALALDRFGLDRRTHRFLLGQIENLRRADRGRAYVIDQYEEQCATPILSVMPPSTQAVAEAVATSTGEIARALELLIESADLGTLGTGRTHEDIARRLLARQQRAAQRDQVYGALDFLEQLVAIAGQPDQAFAALIALLPDDPEIQAIAAAFRSTVDLLTAYDVPRDQIKIEMGLARGLNYYTGIVFEIHAVHEAEPDQPMDGMQLCGGGRYDDLIRMVGAGQDTPAIGFAYGLERLHDALNTKALTPLITAPRALVVPIDEADNLDAAWLANRLRAQWPGQPVELYTPPARVLSQALAYADRQSIPYVFIVGADERAAGTVTLRTMLARTQQSIPLAALDQVVAAL